MVVGTDEVKLVQGDEIDAEKKNESFHQTHHPGKGDNQVLNTSVPSSRNMGRSSILHGRGNWADAKKKVVTCCTGEHKADWEVPSFSLLWGGVFGRAGGLWLNGGPAL